MQLDVPLVVVVQIVTIAIDTPKILLKHPQKVRMLYHLQ